VIRNGTPSSSNSKGHLRDRSNNLINFHFSQMNKETNIRTRFIPVSPRSQTGKMSSGDNYIQVGDAPTDAEEVCSNLLLPTAVSSPSRVPLVLPFPCRTFCKMLMELGASAYFPRCVITWRTTRKHANTPARLGCAHRTRRTLVSVQEAVPASCALTSKLPRTVPKAWLVRSG